MLANLLEYAQTSGLNSEPGFARKSVRWGICCDAQGNFTAVLLLGDKRGREFPICPDLSQGELVSGGSPRCHFLVESLATLALYWKQDEVDRKCQQFRNKQKFFLSMLQQASDIEPTLSAAYKLLSNQESIEKIQTELTTQKAKPTDSSTLIINSYIPLAQNSWHDWWRSFRQNLSGTETGKSKDSSNRVRYRCLATGEAVNAAETHPKIKGLAGVGGLGTGDVLIGFDKAAFQSYGLRKSHNAAVSAEIATAYADALNHLIDKHSVKLGETLSTYWFKEAVEDEEDPLICLIGLNEERDTNAMEDTKKLLNTIREGRRPELANNRFYNLLLSGASGRVMVRDWIETDFAKLVENISGWFDDLNIVARQGGAMAPPPKFMAVAGAMVRDLKELPSPLMQSLWRCALDRHRPIPGAVMAKVLQRTRIDFINNEAVRHARMGLLKAYHCRQNKGVQTMRAKVNPEHPDSAYHCGRLLAVLARLQRSALGDVGAGVVQRYYTAASQTPALVIGRLMANAKNHLNDTKVRGKLAYWFEQKIAAIMVQIGDQAPSTLNLERQSLFALGYYQQLADLSEKKESSDANNKPSED
jgi:CRISPR-associated protein Csd1